MIGWTIALVLAATALGVSAVTQRWREYVPSMQRPSSAELSDGLAAQARRRLISPRRAAALAIGAGVCAIATAPWPLPSTANPTAEGVSGGSGTVGVEAPPLVPPSGLACDLDWHEWEATLRWDAVEGAERYGIYHGGPFSGDMRILEAVTAPQTTYDDLRPSFLRHRYYVTAANGTGEGPASDTISVHCAPRGHFYRGPHSLSGAGDFTLVSPALAGPPADGLTPEGDTPPPLEAPALALRQVPLSWAGRTQHALRRPAERAVGRPLPRDRDDRGALIPRWPAARGHDLLLRRGRSRRGRHRVGANERDRGARARAGDPSGASHAHANRQRNPHADAYS